MGGGDFDFIKMDIEGMELKVLKGACNTLKTDVKMSVCTYHNPNDLENISNFLRGFNFKIDTSRGYMAVYNFDFRKPYLRKGLIRVWK